MSEINEKLELTTANCTNGTGWKIIAEIYVAPTIYEETDSKERTKDRAFKLLGRIKDIVNEAIKEEEKSGLNFKEVIGFKKDHCIYPSPKISSTRWNGSEPDYCFESMRKFVELDKKKKSNEK